MEIEDRALERLYAALDIALFRVQFDDPDIEWRNTRER